MPAEKVDIALDGAKEGNIQNICALRGDAPVGQETWEVVEGGFACGLDLVKYIREKHGDHFSLCVAGYPEGHPDTIKKVEDPSTLTESERARAADMEDGVYVCSDEDYEKDLEYLKRKIDAGGDFIVTQVRYRSFGGAGYHPPSTCFEFDLPRSPPPRGEETCSSFNPPPDARHTMIRTLLLYVSSLFVADVF